MRDPNSDFLSPLSDGVRRDRIEPHGRKEERDTRENGEHQAEHAEGPSLIGEHLLHGLDVEEGQVRLDRRHSLSEERCHSGQVG